METSFTEFVNQRNIEIGIKCLYEAVGDEANNQLPVGKAPPVPKNISIPNIPPEKKSWLKRWWSNHKTAIKYGALGAAAIGLLLSAGIPWGQLFPYLGKSIGTALGVQAVTGGINSLGQQAEGKPAQIVIKDHDYFLKTNSGETKIDANQVVDMIGQSKGDSNHIKAVIWRDESSRASTESELLNTLREKGLQDSVKWKDTFEFEPNTVPSTDWKNSGE
jgi:hypothetical protein